MRTIGIALDAATIDRLGRLAVHKGTTINAIAEQLVAAGAILSERQLPEPATRTVFTRHPREDELS